MYAFQKNRTIAAMCISVRTARGRAENARFNEQLNTALGGKMSDVRVSVIIPTRSNLPFLTNAIESLIPTLEVEDEIIIVANGEPEDIDGTVGYITGLQKSSPIPLKLVVSDPGYMAASNAGLTA